MAWSRGHDIVHFLIILLFGDLAANCIVTEVLLDSWAKNMNELIILGGPAIVNAALVLTNLFADLSVDSEATVSSVYFTAIVVLDRDIENHSTPKKVIGTLERK